MKKIWKCILVTCEIYIFDICDRHDICEKWLKTFQKLKCIKLIGKSYSNNLTELNAKVGITCDSEVKETEYFKADFSRQVVKNSYF